jgi:mannose-6-phosphate isomerase-like protein (cupin superfamily)
VDEAIANAGLKALSAASAAGTGATNGASNGDVATGAVSYFPSEQVRASFAKGAVLYDGAGRNYMVHTSRRTESGMAEVHAQDTDIIYVQDGTATLVTGGTVVDGKDTAPGEIRGARIASGSRHALAKGDVVIVPNGTPHQFEDVRAPFTYYVVKVR